MKSLSRRYLTNVISRIIFGCLALIFLATLVFNMLLFSFYRSVLSDKKEFFSQRLSVAHIIFIPPWFVVLKNVAVQEIKSPSGKEFIFVPTIMMRLSFAKLLLKQQVYFSDIRLYRAVIQYKEFSLFLKDNFTEIVEFIRNLPRQDIRCALKEARFALSPKTGVQEYIEFSSDLRIKKEKVLGSFTLAKLKDTSSLDNAPLSLNTVRSLPLRCNFNGYIVSNELSMENIEFARENIYAKLWGTFDGAILRLNGFSFINTKFKEEIYDKSVFSIFQNTRSVIQIRNFDRPFANLSRVDLYILDIDCLVNIAFPQVLIKHLAFSLNNNPIRIEGAVLLEDNLSFDITCVSTWTAVEEAKGDNIKKISLALAATIKNDILFGNGTLKFNFIEKKGGSLPLLDMQVKLEGLQCSLANLPFLPLSIARLEIFCKTDANNYRINLQEAFVKFRLHNEWFKFADFNSTFYDGTLNGWAKLDITQKPARLIATAKVRDVSANKLDGILVHFSKVFGKLSSEMRLYTYPQLYLEGNMTLQKGYIQNFEFFKWLADFFGLTSLAKVDFQTASANFLVNADGAGLNDITLDSENLKLKGDFTLNINDLVNSKLSLDFSRGTLLESKKLAPLVRLLGKDVSSLTFDFKLSGWLHGMNFLWLQSDFKQRLQKSIPNFIERRIEKEVEFIIQSLSPSK